MILPARSGKLTASKQGRFWTFREADEVDFNKRMEKLRAKESGRQ
jgi:hypothetical protein